MNVDDVVDAVVHAGNQDDESQVLKVLTAQLFGDDAKPGLEALTDLVAYVSLERDGTVETEQKELAQRTRIAIRRLTGREPYNTEVPTETTIKTYAKDFGQKPKPGDVVDDSRPYDVEAWNKLSDNLLLASAEAALLMGQVPDRGFAAGTDHHWTPSSSTTKTQAGRAAQPAFKDGQPIYRGRPNAHGRNHINIQFATGLEPLTISIREGRPTAGMLEEQMAVLQRLSLRPRVFTCDKEYPNQFKMPPIRAVLDAGRIPLAGALSHSHFAIGEVAGYWDSHDAAPLFQSGTPLFVKVVNKDFGGYRGKALIFYSETRSRNKLRSKLDSEGRVTMDVNDQIYSFILYTNLDVTEADVDVIWWLYCQYASRWGTLESYYREMVQGVVRSQAHTMFWRNWWYLAGCLALNAMAAWRARKRLRIKRLQGWVKDLSYDRCRVAALSNIEERAKERAMGA